MPSARNTRISASSVPLFPRDRMRDITSLRFFLVKTSDMIATKMTLCGCSDFLVCRLMQQLRPAHRQQI